ncbi:hypothetical protein [Roseobacter sp. HKCCD7870]|uniref:hypothetical protein n=1 Tax=Roseobacter sp. HKCCD7870 TaxID=3120343 RepID=UPI0030ED15A0
MLKKILAAASIATAPVSPVGGFELDRNYNELVGSLAPTVSDLAVSVPARIHQSEVCHDNGHLYVINTILRNTPYMGVNFEIIRRPDGSFDLTFINDDYGVNNSDEIALSDFGFYRCRDDEFLDGPRFLVNSIDGYSEYSAWVNFLLSTKQLVLP